MAYPDTELPVVVQIAPGASPTGTPGSWQWTDVTTSVRESTTITIAEGRGDWGDQVDAGSCSLTFDNASGNFSQYNPNGQWYGLLGKDTPLRVRLRRAEDTFGRTVSNGWGVCDSGQAWTVTAGPTGDWSVGSGSGTVSISSVNAYRRGMLSTTLLDAEQRISITPSAALTGASLVWQARFRYLDGNNSYSCSVELDRNLGSGQTVTCKLRKMVAGTVTELAVASPVPGLLYTAGQPVHMRASVVGTHLAVKAWTGSTEPAASALEVDDSTFTGPGQVGQDVYLVAGNTNTLPYVVSADNYQLDVDLVGGFVPSWVPRWDLAGLDRVVPVVARGTLYRLQPGQSSPPVRSALARALTTSSPIAYWPLEDGEDSTQAASGIPGGGALTVNAGIMAFGTEAPVGSAGSAAPAIDGDQALRGQIAGGSASAWQMSIWTRGDAVSGTHTTAYYVPAEIRTSTGKILRFFLQESSATIGIAEYNDDTVTSANNFTAVTFTQLGNRYSIGSGWHCVQAVLVQSGADVLVDVWVDGVLHATGTWVGVTLGAPTSVSAIGRFGGVSGDISAQMSTIYLAHLAVHNGAALVDQYSAGLGWPGETAGARIARLCAEADIPVDVLAGATEPMGPQPAATLPALLRECETADGGTLYEKPFTLAYRPRETYYNQGPALTLDFQGDLGDAPEPDGTDQRYRNAWTVRRPRGSTAVARSAGVIAGTELERTASADVNVASDDRLQDQAGWRLHMTSSRELAWPQLELNLAARPALIDAWLSCRQGARISATNPLPDVAGQDVDVVLEGRQATLGYKTWTVVANCSPGRLWDVAVADGVQRAGAEGSTLASNLAAGALSLSVASTVANGIWTVDPVDYPLDVRVGGERVTVGAVGQVLNANPWFEVDASGWTAFGATATRSTAQAHQGVASLLLTPDGVSSGPRVECGSRPVSAGAQIRLSTWVRCATSRTVGLSINWFDGSGTYMSTSSAPSVAVTATTWTPLTFVATAPAGTGRASGNVLLSGVAPATDLLHIDEAVLVPTATYATSPQTMTIAPGGRGVNGVSRAWSTGAEVDVWSPAVSAL